jgi:P27 family predicted phage terminase small subunit
MRGRKPKPTRLKILYGNPGRRPLNHNEPTPGVATPRCPAHLCDEAKAEWKRISRELHALGLLARIDRAALAAYCQAWARWVKAEGLLKHTGEVLKSQETGAFYQNPYLSVANRALEQMHRFLTEFGMTPSSRSRIHVTPQHATDELGAFLNQA